MSDTDTTEAPDTSNDYKKLPEPSFWTGIGHGLASLVGVGEYYDVAGDISNATTNAQLNLQTTILSLTTQAVFNQTNLDNDLIQYIKANNAVLNQSIDTYNSISSNNFLQNNIFLKIFSLLMFIFLIFMLGK